MKRVGWPVAGIVVASLLTVVYFMAQPSLSAANGLILEQKFPNHTSWLYTADIDEKEELIASAGEDGIRVWRLGGPQSQSQPAGG